VEADVRLSHPNPACVVAALTYVLAIRHLIRKPGDSPGAIDVARKVAEADGEVHGWLVDALEGRPVPYTPQDGFVKIGFSHAFRHLAAGTSYEAALRETLLGGGDTDTNACIVGGLVGARLGASAIPSAMKAAVLGADLDRGKNPRPRNLHPRDVPSLIDTLLCL
jgi:ADP-ribosylglycohydrolase